MANGSNLLNSKVNAFPEKKYENAVAVTAEMIIGTRAVRVISSISTSKVKTKPAIGALKIPLIAPAAPHPTNNIRFFWSILKNFPKFEPMAEPASTTGASAPTYPPNPIVIELPTIEVQTL